ncbi:PQ-loop domain-containing transporter [Thermoactinomyces daqus]|uniref:PQ-loop domain-containing transporter n=1 Tax=Thermoactinomyces daqus TaxID=1329516 RepID=UPI00215D8F55|nr:PQ-loop domain-containing transporter [Thermoactinomyces daqus]
MGWIPQIVQIWRTKSVKDLNIKSYLMVLLGISLMEVYALSLATKGLGYAFLITNTLSLVIILVLVILILRYKK